MQNNKVFSILQKFDTYEQNRLRKFVQSPYFNRNERLEKLLEILLKDVKSDHTTISFNRNEIWRKIGHKSTYDDVKLRKDFSDLLRLTEKFIAQEHYEKNGLYEAEFLLSAIHEKKMSKLEAGTKKLATRLLERFPLRSSEYYLHAFKLDRSKFLMNHNIQVKGEKKNIETVSKNLDIFYICEKIRYYCYIISSQRITTHKYELKMLKEVIQEVEDSEYKEIPAIAIYYQHYLTLIDVENEAHYFKLKSLLDQYGLIFPKEEAYNLYTSTTNYCARKVNSGQPKFLEEYFDIMVDFIEKEIIFLDDFLAPGIFDNMVTTGLRLEKFLWVESFIKKYSDKLVTKYRENVVTFNTARLHWYRKDFDIVIRLLIEVEYDEIHYNLISKTMLITTYYDTNEIEPLFSLLGSFRTFLNRHKEIPQHRRDLYLNLIRFIKKMVNTLPNDKKAIEKLHKEIIETKSIANKDWLLEKLAELS